MSWVCHRTGLEEPEGGALWEERLLFKGGAACLSSLKHMAFYKVICAATLLALLTKGKGLRSVID